MGFGIKSGSKLIFYSAWVGWIWKSVHLKAGRAKELQDTNTRVRLAKIIKIGLIRQSR
jgi:hypothetical protein